MQRSNKSKNPLEKKWLITGGLGFVGTNLRIALKDEVPKSKVFIVDNDTYDTQWRDLERIKKGQIRYFEVDVINYEAMHDVFLEVKPDYVVHLAANTEVRKSVARPMACFSDNVQGTLNCLDLSKEFKAKKIIVASSCGVIGDSCIIGDEGSEFNALSPYASSKVCAEELSRAYLKLGVPVTVLRFSNIFGPWSAHKNSVVVEFIRSYMDAKPITVYGDGTQTRNFLYVKDAINAIFKVVEKEADGVFCIASLRSYSINELIEILNEKFGYRVERHTKPEAQGEVRDVEINTSKARSNLHFGCEYSILDGVNETYNWYKEMQNAD
jgi:UDP-glucose 4-epimerase